MGTVVKRPRKDKTTAFLAKVSIMRDGQTHRENKTFDKKAAALAWIAAREEELSKPGEIQRATVGRPTLADAIDKYTVESVKKMGKSKRNVLKNLKTFAIAGKACEDIESQDIVSLAAELGKTRKPQTVAVYLSHLSAVFSIARPAWGFKLDEATMLAALKVTRRLGLTKQSDERDRRPTWEELDRILTAYSDRSIRRPDQMPMRMIVPFALFSTRRQEEICRIEWTDLDPKHSRVLVRDMKHPGEKIGNDTWVDLPPEALAIINAMPKISKRIFPYEANAISKSFTLMCKVLEIEDLRFHDLRHDGVSRLFEMGRSIPQAATVSGHRSWESLKRYTHIRQSGDKYKGWPWLKLLTKPTSKAA
ncbi:site-specific integrase [Rhizobium leguminosarum]|uniref:site-specific integrase n=1 Tax=Rhizobium leguminosarum TaxID=384 RepID=UPI001C919EB7|nr:site-specific integrase [Rhizobium leguminosarum]MBY3055013.1 site-specific integrase [Rhizobium leguminosarum]